MAYDASTASIASLSLGSVAARLAGGGPQSRRERLVAEHFADRGGERRGIARLDQQRGVIAGQGRNAAGSGGHDGRARPQRLLEHQRLSLPAARQHEDSCGGEQRWHVVALAEEPHAVAKRRGQCAKAAGERPVSGDRQERRRAQVLPAGGGLEEGGEPLLRREAADGEDERAVRREAVGPRWRGWLSGLRSSGARLGGGDDRPVDTARARGAHPAFQIG